MTSSLSNHCDNKYEADEVRVNMTRHILMMIRTDDPRLYGVS